MRNLVTGSVFACMLTVLAAAETPPSVVEAHVVLATDAAHAGSSLKAAVVAQITSGYHINDHKPTLDYLIPTELKLDSTKEIAVGNVTYPKGTLVKFGFSDTALSVYQDSLLVGATLKIAPATPPGSYVLKGSLAYQACNDHACLAPANVPLMLSVKVVAPGVAVKRVNEDVFNRFPSDRTN